MIYEFLINEQVNYLAIALLSFLFAFLLSTPYFTVQFCGSIGRYSGQWLDKKIPLDSKLKKLMPPTFKGKTELKICFLVIGICMLLLASVIIANYVITHWTSGPKFPQADYLGGYYFFAMGIVFIIGYLRIYSESDKALYFMENASKDITRFLESGEPKPSIRNFEVAFSSYQKNMIACSLKDLRKVLRQTELTLKRGTNREISTIRSFTKSFEGSIKTQDEYSFDRNYKKFVSFLNNYASTQKDMINLEINEKQPIKNSLVDWIKPILTQVLIFILALVIIAIIYMTFGINLTQLGTTTGTLPITR